MKKYCVDLEIAKELEESGFPQETYFWWNECFITKISTYEIHSQKGYLEGKHLSAPTSDEILKELPITINKVKNLTIHKGNTEYYVNYQEYNKHPIIYDKILSNALAKMWLYLKKEGYIE